jgi:RNase P subunit RPR2
MIRTLDTENKARLQIIPRLRWTTCFNCHTQILFERMYMWEIYDGGTVHICQRCAQNEKQAYDLFCKHSN